MGTLDGRTALVTGASRGIGRGIAEGLAAAGATVAVNHPPGDGDDAADTVAAIEVRGGTATAVEADVSDADAVRSMVATVERDHGTVDVLCNNAGIVTPSPLAEMSVERWDETIAVNLRGVFLPTRFALPGMLDADGGRVINVASQLAFAGAADHAHYCAAKGGVVSFTRALAREVAPDVTVNAIAPGPTETAMLDDVDAEGRAALADRVPMGRLGTVDDVAPTAVFLAGPDGDYYTGQTLSPDGGDAMH